MGKERDKLIRSLGGVPLSDQNLSDQEILRRRMARYAEEGRLPPEIDALRAREQEGTDQDDRGETDRGEKVLDAQPRVVGYGTLLSRASLARTVGGDAQDRVYRPVVVEGYRRSFNLKPDHYEPSFHVTDKPTELGALNVQPIPGARFNGLLYAVTPRELAALDERERYYHRIQVEVAAFPEGTAIGLAYVYSAGPDSPWVVDDPEVLQPHWRDITLAREGAYSLSRPFGQLFDQTTWMAGGEVLAVEAYRDHLAPVSDDEPV